MSLYGAARYDTYRYAGVVPSYDESIYVPDWAQPFRLEVWEFDGTRVRVIPEILGGTWKRTTNAPASLNFRVQIDGPGVDSIRPTRKLLLFDASGKPCGTFKITHREWVHEGGMALLNVRSVDYLGQLEKEAVLDYSATEATVTEILTGLLALQLQGDPIKLGLVDSYYDSLSMSVNFTRQSLYDCLRDLRSVVGGVFCVGGDDMNELNWMKSGDYWTYKRTRVDGIWQWANVDARVKQLRYGRNISSIARALDYSQLVTRLYAYGSGDDEFNRVKLDVGGEEYIDSANTATYGIITDIWTDKRYDLAANLELAAVARLDELDDPAETWDIGIVDLYHINPGVYPHEELEIGQTVAIIDDELTIDGETVSEEATINAITVDLLTPANSSVTAGLRRRTVADTIGDLKREVKRLPVRDANVTARWVPYE